MEKAILIENFFQKYQYTVAALGVMATFFVAGLSLWLSYRARFSRITSFIYVKRLYENYDGTITEHTPFRKVIALDITNHGPNTIFIEKFSSFAMKVPLTTHGYETIVLNISEEGTDILPGKSINFNISAGNETPEDFFDAYFDGLLRLYQDKWLQLLLLRVMFGHIQFYIRTSDGRFVKVKVSSNLRKLIYERAKNIN